MNHILGLVAAAGAGTRMNADRPKQYLALGSRTVLERAVESLLAEVRVARVLVVVAPGDAAARALHLPPRCALADCGGPTRADSVRNGLRVLATQAGPDDWVLVHDAARPCLGADDLAALIDSADEDGALLALPIADTVKRAKGTRVDATIERAGLWRALTPQLFRLGVLERALERAQAAGEHVSDEALAVERLGLHPRLVEGSAANIKVTRAGDLRLAEAVLRQQERW